MVRLGAATAWRLSNPGSRATYLPQRPQPLARLYYEAVDGWRAPLLHVRPAPGGSGEPVVLVHALGAGPDVFRIGDRPTLVSALSAAGFSVYLLGHRGDRGAVAPHPHAEVHFDEIAARDLPAAVDRVAAHSGFERVHLVGHGLGGQLVLAAASRRLVLPASVVVMCAPTRFVRPSSGLTRMTLVASLLPVDWAVPTSTIGPLVAPFVGEGEGGVALRGALHWGAGTVSAPMVRQLLKWIATGSLVDATGFFDYHEALSEARAPLLVLAAPEDTVAPPWTVTSAAERWGGIAKVWTLPAGYGHNDPLFSTDAPRDVYGPVAGWLTDRRRLAW